MTVTAAAPTRGQLVPQTLEAPEPQTPAMLMQVARDAAAKATTARTELEDAVVKIRDAGATWRDISAAVGMTEHGVAKLYARVKGAQA